MKNKKITLQDHDDLAGGIDDSLVQYVDLTKPKTQYEAMMKSLCNEICRVKMSSKVSTKEFCQKCGISEATYSNINLRKVGVLSMDTLFQILENNGDIRARKRIQILTDLISA